MCGTEARLNLIGNLCYKKVILGVWAGKEAPLSPIGNICHKKVYLGVRAANV